MLRSHFAGHGNGNTENTSSGIDGFPADLVGYFLDLENNRTTTLEKFSQNWTRAIQGHLDLMQLSTVLHRTAKFVNKIPEKNIKAAAKTFVAHSLEMWEDFAIVKINHGQFKPRNLANSLWAYAALGVLPSPAFMKAWKESASDYMWAGDFNPQNLVNSLWAYASLALLPPASFLEAWQHNTAHNISDFNEQDLTNGLWACAVLHAIGSDSYIRAIAENLHRNINPEFLIHEKDKTQFVQACLWFDLPCALELDQEPDCHSETEMKFVNLFRKSVEGIHSKTYTVPHLRHKPDEVLEGSPVLILEVDGPTHLLNGCEEGHYEITGYNGSTLFQSALMCKFVGNAVVMRMPFPVVESILDYKSPKLQKEGLQNLVRRSSHLPAGAYRLDLQGSVNAKLSNQTVLHPLYLKPGTLEAALFPAGA